MKKSLKFLALFVFSILLLFVVCSCNNDKGETGGKSEPPKVCLETLTLDDSRYSIDFDKNTTEYKVNLPAGRPTVPKISATAGNDVEVKISQAAIPDENDSGSATVYLTAQNGDKSTYTVEFIKDKANGFVLQYDDRYEFKPENSGKYTFTSSDPSVVSVDENGLMTALKVSENAVTITAKGNGSEETLTVDRVEKAHINLFLITGQSNGQGYYDIANYGKEVANIVKYDDQIALVEKIGQMGRVYSYDVSPIVNNRLVMSQKGKMYDMEKYAKQGHQAALGKTFYDLSGEKVVFLQTAYNGAPIESWLDLSRHEEAGRFDGDNFYQITKTAYDKLINILKDNYEIVYTANFWCQGETAMTAIYDHQLENYITSSNSDFDKSKLMTDETYYNYFMMLHNDMKEDFNVQYNGIMVVRTSGASTSAAIVPVISAQFALANTNDDIYIATRKFAEIARMYSDRDKTSEGYGFVGTDNVHYNQIGYNYHGKEAGTNAFDAIFGVYLGEKQTVEMIANDGISRLSPTSMVKLYKGEHTRIAALSYNEKVTWSVDKEGIVTVNEFGVITALSSGSVNVTVTTESGAKQSVYVLVS